jgi:hypothetical protein
MTKYLKKTISASARRPGSVTGNAGSCEVDLKQFSTVSRNQLRRAALFKAAARVNEIAGGEKRRIRRSMARGLAKRVIREVVD